MSNDSMAWAFHVTSMEMFPSHLLFFNISGGHLRFVGTDQTTLNNEMKTHLFRPKLKGSTKLVWKHKTSYSSCQMLTLALLEWSLSMRESMRDMLRETRNKLHDPVPSQHSIYLESGFSEAKFTFGNCWLDPP